LHFICSATFIGNVIIIIIIDNGQTGLTESQASLEHSASFDPVFTYLDFSETIFSLIKVVYLKSNPKLGGPGPCIYVPQ
jgi:hypothetical protein